MDYISILIKVLPVAGCTAVGLYGVIYQLTKNKRAKPSLTRISCEFSLVAWCIMFLYVTQVLSFGNGLGEQLNLMPLKPLVIAIKYGSVNAVMLIQILLNIIMCLPLGFLLPLTYGNKCKGFLPVLEVSLALAFLTEILQLITGRNADIDDVIANTLGGVLGFAFYVFALGIGLMVKPGRGERANTLRNYHRHLAISILLLLLTVSPFALIKVLEAGNEIGYVYYGHLQPTYVVIPDRVNAEETAAELYRNIQVETRESLASRLLQASEFDCTFSEVGYDTLRCSLVDDTKAIFIYKYNTWTVLYKLGADPGSDQRRLPSEADAVDIAQKSLEAFQISPHSLAYAGLSQKYDDGNLHLVFTDKSSTKERFVWGVIEITIGEGGALMEISDRRTYHEFVKTVETISPRKAIDIAKDVGVGEWNGTATVLAIEPSYYFNEDTGFLMPTWQIHATFVSRQGQKFEWNPNIAAIK